MDAAAPAIDQPAIRTSQGFAQIDGSAILGIFEPEIHLVLADEAFADIEQKSPCEVRAYDIAGFFDSLDHKRLKHSWCRLLNEDSLPDDHYAVFKSITRLGEFSKRLIKNRSLTTHSSFS